MWDCPEACVEEEPPLVDTLGADWRHAGGEREWRWGGHRVDRGGAADGYVHGRASGGGRIGAPVAGVARPVVSSMLQAEAAWPKPSSMQVAVSAVGQTEGGAPEASFVDVVTG